MIKNLIITVYGKSFHLNYDYNTIKDIILNILDNKKDTSLSFYQLSKYILKYSISNKEVLDYDERTFYDDPKLCKDDLNLISSVLNELLREGKIEIDFTYNTDIKFKLIPKFILDID